MLSRSRRGAAVAAACLAVLGLVAPSARAAGAGDERRPVPKPDQSVTLVTGDQVILQGGDPAKVQVRPGPGRRTVGFRAFRSGDRLFVIPADVSSEVASGRVDRRLFDVTGLIEDGYHDGATKVIPLVLTYSGRAAARTALAGTTVTRQLPSINGSAVTVGKADAARFLRGLSTARTSPATIWLDGKRRVSLDRSVPQIGAPAAWQAGYTGKGVSVAVLDTGIDATHPDLAARVAGARNFTTEPAGDQVGHGTHVASTIAGTAAASAGKYRGVAPDAKLYDGKVCELNGCTESAIIAGMEWAATEVGAKVVNLSLGGQDTPEVDPIEAAVNQLTAQTGSLFVVAAGNTGPGAGSVESPGSAEAALTVGAVDQQNALAEFSSRGPRVGDGGVKPDVTAPGVDIVAARSKDAVIGEPAGDRYLRLSGTSMATPHTAGAAALLAQAHPAWKATELKAALMASAKPADDQSAFEQGTGRIDAARAMRQTVVTQPGSLSFGTARWPHADDTPVTKTLTYRNLGNQQVTLALRATLTGPDGAPAPAGALKLSTTTVTVPAGGTASVRATSDTRHNGPDGAYSGRVTATGGGVTVVSAIGVDKEVESYDLTAASLGPDGKATGGNYLLWGVSQDRFEFFGDTGGTSRIRLPKGDYVLDASQFRPRGDRGDAFKLVAPLVRLDRDKTVRFDARQARPVGTAAPRPGARSIIATIGYERTSPDGERTLSSLQFSDSFDGLHTAQLGPRLPAAELVGSVTSHWGVRNADETFTNTPYEYGLVTTVPGEFPTGFSRKVQRSELARVEVSTNAAAGRQGERGTMGFGPGMSFVITPIIRYDLPAKTVLHLEAGAVNWSTMVSEVRPSTDPENPFPTPVTELEGAPTQYEAGRTYRERFNAAAFVPKAMLAQRTQSGLVIGIGGYSDADGHLGFSLTDTASSKLYRDGQLVGESPYYGYVELSDVPAGAAAYRYVTSATRPSVSGFSTRSELSWAFRSAGGAEEVFPLRTVRYLPDVDSRNTAKRSAVTVMPLRLDAVPGAELAPVRKLELRVSGDDGKTWQRAAVVPAGGDAYKAVFRTPLGAKAVSLKASLVDAEGNSTEQTTIAAYALR